VAALQILPVAIKITFLLTCSVKLRHSSARAQAPKIRESFFYDEALLLSSCVVDLLRPLGRPRRRWEDNIKMDLQDVGWGHGQD
jgi:hypothetical protein